MKQIENDTIPFGTFVAFNYFGLVFVKRLLLPDERNPAADRVADPLRDGAPGADSCLRIILAVALYCADLLPCRPVLHPLGPRMVAAAIRHGIPRHSPRAGVLRQPGRSDVSETPQMVRMG